MNFYRNCLKGSPKNIIRTPARIPSELPPGVTKRYLLRCQPGHLPFLGKNLEEILEENPGEITKEITKKKLTIPGRIFRSNVMDEFLHAFFKEFQE